MPIDPSIPLGATVPQVLNPYDMFVQMQRLQQTRADQQALADEREMRTQQIAALTANTRAQGEERQRQTFNREAAMRGIALIQGGNAQQIFDQLRQQSPEAADMAEQWYVQHQKNRQAMDQITALDRKQRADLARAAGYDPTITHILIGVDSDPQARQLLDAVGDDPVKIKNLVDHFASWDPNAKAPQPVQMHTMENGQEVNKFVIPEAGASYPVPPPKPPNPVPVQTMQGGQPVTKFVVPTEGATYPTQPPKTELWPNATGPGGATDAKDAIAGMKQGLLPPLMPGRASKEYTAMMAEAKRQQYDLAGAVTDWNAVQKYVATANGSQQTRLRQSIDALPHALDVVEELAKKWKGGQFPILNRANLIAAKNGIYGSDVANVANQLDAQIADVVSDLGNVYMGGNSPTDHALDLAKKSLSSDWDLKVLQGALGLARTNVGIRKNSITTQGPAQLSGNTPYWPNQGGRGPEGGGASQTGIRVTSPSGKTYPASGPGFRTQADADDFVARAKAQGLWK